MRVGVVAKSAHAVGHTSRQAVVWDSKSPIRVRQLLDTN
jgi:hypothetical protein